MLCYTLMLYTYSVCITEDGTLAQPDAGTLAKLAGASKGIRHLVRDHVPKVCTYINTHTHDTLVHGCSAA
jgi:hypothetical protein